MNTKEFYIFGMILFGFGVLFHIYYLYTRVYKQKYVDFGGTVNGRYYLKTEPKMFYVGVIAWIIMLIIFASLFGLMLYYYIIE